MRTLRARAAALARPLAEGRPEARTEVLEFLLDGNRYAVETRLVREVATNHEAAKVPGVPSFVRGLVSVRGEIVSVVDLGPLLGLAPARAPRRSPVLIVLSSGPMTFGIEADDLVGVARMVLPDGPRFRPTERRTYLLHVTDDGLAVLDGELLLADERLVVRDGGRAPTVPGRPAQPSEALRP